MCLSRRLRLRPYLRRSRLLRPPVHRSTERKEVKRCCLLHLKEITAPRDHRSAEVV